MVSYPITHKIDPAYNTKGAEEIDPVKAVQLINAPQLNANPKNNCGQLVMRLAKG